MKILLQSVVRVYCIVDSREQKERRPVRSVKEVLYAVKLALTSRRDEIALVKIQPPLLEKLRRRFASHLLNFYFSHERWLMSIYPSSYFAPA